MSRVHAFFDFDDTLLDGDSILYWLRFYYQRRPSRRIFQVMNWAALVGFSLKLIDSHTLKRILLFPMGWEHPEELDRLAAEFVRTDLASHFHAPVLQRLWTHHLLGHKIVILSASATFYLRHLKAFLPMADIQGSEIIWQKPGSFSIPRYKDGNLRGENKITRMRALGYGSAAPLSFAYSDHHHDIFLLRFSEFPFCIRPTPKLHRLAIAEGWPVIDWPGNLPRWKIRLGKLRLLLFAAGPVRSATCDPVREAARAREYAPTQVRELAAVVSRKYSRATNPQVHADIFGTYSMASPTIEF